MFAEVVRGSHPPGPLAVGNKWCVDAGEFLAELLLNRSGWLQRSLCVSVVKGSVRPKERRRRFEELAEDCWETPRLTTSSFLVVGQDKQLVPAIAESGIMVLGGALLYL